MPELHAWRIAADNGQLAERLESRALFSTPVTQVTPSSSATVTIHLEYQCVSLGYFNAGQAW
jgi:hypothetical protein